MKVAVGLSGGVDSAVSAMLLKEKGHDVTGVYLHCWDSKKNSGCKANEDKKSALKVALELKIPFKVLDFSKEYEDKVIDYFYKEYKVGRTPNPDVMCNSEIKFGMFLRWVMENNFDYVATGHYAKKDGDGLMVPKDRHKDQTYFLWKLKQKELKKVLFPLGEYLKSEVRDMAKKAKLSVAGRLDSQGICFVGKVNVKDFLKKRLKVKKGDVLDADGNKIGEHDGVWFYTIGQRGGWEMVAKYKDPIPPLYVVSKNRDRNELVVGEDEDAKRKVFQVGELSWIGAAPNFCLGKTWSGKVRIRHCGELLKVKVSNGKVRNLYIEMEERQRGVASGQSVVFYSGEGECLGGGVIK
jgi:tRNA-uridine 2-sulfurtransferase